ncbi:uncharacterized protein MYCGRDRAFT_107697 [Zymoseptoria tritici IPO323]|uniref:Uncharacterized protein n=1 Tax=Zymoseptoria tritici (strain CBS 115943 / IPO323) TaxID=336722 RepID=F9WYM8_ZYMTI|nr:uncharacterized protein MYCGRDRAFT_107697 [Zymoseptoria tritici IPO323]EGP91927.1 hypothetical protein MYCGRDRAFT_107697 [Zymoseptoria tritici IPO323]
MDRRCFLRAKTAAREIAKTTPTAKVFATMIPPVVEPVRKTTASIQTRNATALLKRSRNSACASTLPPSSDHSRIRVEGEHLALILSASMVAVALECPVTQAATRREIHASRSRNLLVEEDVPELARLFDSDSDANGRNNWPIVTNLPQLKCCALFASHLVPHCCESLAPGLSAGSIVSIDQILCDVLDS